MVIAPGILLAIATYEGNDNCISVGFITGMRVGNTGLSFELMGKNNVWLTKFKSDGTGISSGQETFLNL